MTRTFPFKPAALALIFAVLAAPDATIAAPTVGMVVEPCTPTPPPPPEVVAALQRFLEPGASMAEFVKLMASPTFAAFNAARAESDKVDPNGLCRHASANAALRARAIRPDIVFMGDSITENWVLGDPSLFSDKVVGRGISGQTSAQMLVRFHADVVALRPKTVHIMAGTNDVAGNGGLVSEQSYKDNISAMVEIARAHKIRVVLASIPPAAGFLWRPELKPAAQITRLNAWLKSYARTEGIRYLDYHAVLADPQGGLRAEFAPDGVHPNRAGYAAVRALADSAK